MALKLSQLDGSNGFRVIAADLSDISGFATSGAGDVNGDGIDDLIVGMPGAVVFGTAGGFGPSFDLGALDGSNGFRLDGTGAYSVAGAGDVNGDGIDDVIVGDPGAVPSAGTSYVVLGSAAGFGARLDLGTLNGANGFRLEGNQDEDLSGYSVAGVGDINGDGVDDLIIRAARADPDGRYQAGESYVVFGTIGGFAANFDLRTLDGSNGFRLDGIDELDESGRRVAGAGDINGDGIEDLIIGTSGAGEIYVVFGSSTGFEASLGFAELDGDTGFRLDGTGTGYSVAGAGDVNGDGIDDLIVGAPHAGPYYAGESFVVFGSTAGFGANIDLAALDGSDGFRIDGGGQSVVAGAGDVNGDGLEDLIIGDGGADFRAGASYLVFGSATSFGASVDLATLDGTNGARIEGIDAQDASGFSVAGAGDINGDGIDDIVIGAPRSRPGGESYVVYGSTQLGGTNDAPSAADDVLSVSSFDDVDLAGENGAGSDRDPDLDDLTITSIDGITVNAGDSATLPSGLRVTVLGAAQVRFDAPGVALGTVLSDSFVYTISDGRGAGDAATVSVEYLQNSIDLSALDGINGFRLDGGDGSGWSVAGAGDVNGDGIDDLIIGAPSADPGGRFGAGESYVVFGSAGFEASLDLADLDGVNGFRLNGGEEFDSSGWSVAGAGDVNGDGIDDLIIGAPGGSYSSDSSGKSYVVFGSAEGFGASLDLSALDGANGFRLDGVNQENISGWSVAGAGDINGDGVDDLIIGAPGGNYSSDPGKSYVVFGSSAGFGASVDLSALSGVNGFRLDGVDQYDFSGFSVAGAGDVNGDGIHDLVIGANRADRGGRSDAGDCYVVFGSPAGFGASLDLSALDGEERLPSRRDRRGRMEWPVGRGRGGRQR